MTGLRRNEQRGRIRAIVKTPSMLQGITMLNSNQLRFGEGWIAFVLNDEPIHRVQRGGINLICLLDVSSGFILSTVRVPAKETDPSEDEAYRLFEKGMEHNKKLPSRLFIPIERFQTTITGEARRRGVAVISVPGKELTRFTRDARESFREHVQRSRYGA